HSVRDNLARHTAENINIAYADAAKKLHFTSLFDDDFRSGQLAQNLARSVDDNLPGAIQIPTQSPFDKGAPAAYTAAAQVTFGGHMHFAFGANGTAKAGCDFVIA